MNLWGVLLLIAAALLFFFLILPAVLVFFAVFYRKKGVPFEQYDPEKFKSHYYMPYLGRIAEAREWLQQHDHAPVYVTADDGVRLYGEYYDQGSRRTAVLFHGIGAEMYTNLSGQARVLYRSGWNVLLTCQRAHGKSGGRFTAIGLREQDDVLCWARFAGQQGAREILLYGVSMGAASVAYAADRLDGTQVKGIVIDSGFYSIYEQMRRDAYKNHIPKIMLPAQWVLAKLVLRVDIRQPTADTLRRAQAPVLFIHGTADETVEHRWAQVNFDACAAPKRLFLADGAPHTLSIFHNPAQTEEVLQQFLKEHFSSE